jgi:isopenicillin N synthase-like dioxygenase
LIPQTTLDAFYSYWRGWFAQPTAEKMKHLRSPGKGGYYPAGSESPGYTGNADPKEYFHFRIGEHGRLETTALPGRVAHVTREVFWDCHNAAVDWCRERGLDGLPNNVNAADCVLRILHYPPTATGEVGEAHRDFDLLTVSVPGTCGGLEVWKPSAPGVACVLCASGEHVPPGGHWHPRETFEVHVGEMLEIYTDDPASMDRPVPSTLHRVRTPPNTERFKAVFFYLPPNDFELRPGFTAGDYLKEALATAGTADVGVRK